jgi:hypothetical protein
VRILSSPRHINKKQSFVNKSIKQLKKLQKRRERWFVDTKERTNVGRVPNKLHPVTLFNPL